MGRPKKSAVCKTCNRGPTNRRSLKTCGTQTELKLDELDKIISFFLSSSDKACKEAQQTIHQVQAPCLDNRDGDFEVSNDMEEFSSMKNETSDYHDEGMALPEQVMRDDSDCDGTDNVNYSETLEVEIGSKEEMEEVDIDSLEHITDICGETKQASDESEIAAISTPEKKQKVPSTPSSLEIRKSSRLAEKYPTGKSFANPTRKRKAINQKKNIIALKKKHLASLRLKPKTEDLEKEVQKSRSLDCLLCGLSCKTLRELTEHKQEKHEGRVYKCKECGKAFRNVTRLQIHLRCHTGEKPYACPECPKCFPDPSNLAKHVQTIHEHPHRCDNCRSRFATETELLVHQESSCKRKYDSLGRRVSLESTPKPIKKTVKKAKCETCGREVLNLRTHMLTHSTDRPFKCEQCDSVFKSIYDLKKHQMRHRSDKPHLCEHCGKSFKHIFAIKAHMKIHEEPPVKEVHPCKECNMGFAEADQLAAHTECHLNNLPFKCLLCDKEFDTTPELKAHVITHPAARIPVNCNYCDKLYPTLPKMQVHRHTHVSFHMCSFCSKSYSKTSELKRHEATHTGIFNHICEVCNKGFVRPDQLKKHMMVHTGDRRFKCETCERCYITEDTLKTHIKLVHGPKTYICTICGKSFAVEKRLQFHIARHLGKKDYKCDVCGKAFADPSDLPQHKRIHKVVKNFPCLLCPKAFYAQKHLDTHFRVNHKNRMEKLVHACEICGKVFPREWKLKRHRSVHEHKSSRINYLNKPNTPTIIKLEPVDEPDLTDLAESTSMLQSMENVELTETLAVQCSMCGATCETTDLSATEPFLCGLCAQINVSSDDKTSVFTFTGQEIFKCNMCQKTFALLDNFLNHLQEHPELEIKIETLPTEIDQ